MKAAITGSFVHVDAGWNYTCAVRDDFQIECWGSNRFGEAPPTRSSTSGYFVEVSSGLRGTCALSMINPWVSDGVVECWGNGNNGSIAATSPHLFVQVAALPQARSCAAGECGNLADMCALRTDGVVECRAHSLPATKAALSGSFTQITAGGTANALGQYACALRTDGVVECWGANAYGQAPATKTAASESFIQVDAGESHTCAARTDGVVECWGLTNFHMVPSDIVLPTATFHAPVTVDEGSQAALSLTDAQVPGQNGAPFAYAFACGSGLSAFSGTNAADCTAGDGPGTIQVRGVVRDRAGDTQEYTASISILNVAPQIHALADAELLVTETYSAAGTFVDPGEDSHTATVQYGDGGGSSALAIVDGTFHLSHPYTTPGLFRIDVEVTDSDGDAGRRSAAVRVLTVGEFVEGLNGEIDRLVAAGVLKEGQRTSLRIKLDHMLLELAHDRTDAALRQVEGFKRIIDGLVRSGVLTPNQGEAWIASAHRLVAAIQAGGGDTG